MNFRTACLLASVLYFTPLEADADSLLSSIPHAISDKQIYKVVILEIDSQPVQPQLHYRLNAGFHHVTVQLMLEMEWTLDQADQPRMNYLEDMRLEILPGKHYELAAKVDLDATAESLSDGTFWSAFVYRESDL